MNEVVDPRDEHIDTDEILTESSSDELNDLVKLFEAKYEELKRKKALKKLRNSANEHVSHQQSSSILNDHELIKSAMAQVETTPPPSPQHKTAPSLKNLVQSSYKPTIPKVPKSDVKASSFISKLYDANFASKAQSLQKIDYSERKFEFDGVQEIKSVNIEADEVEPISRMRLRKRYIEQKSVEKLVSDINELKYLQVDKLLAKVHKGNNYAEPMYTNWCFVGFVVKKSEPKQSKDKNKSKFIKLSVGNFVRSVDVLLFGEAFNQYWKISPGSLVFILNPYISKYSMGEGNGIKTGFTLHVAGNNTNSILEIGAIRDYGLCTFVKKTDYSRCSNVIDVLKSSLCDFHLDTKYRKSSRMELNGSVMMKSPQKKKAAVYLTNEGVQGNGGFIRFANENTTLYESGTAKIDLKRYHDPRILQTSEKKRKMNDERANQLLERRLSKLLQNSGLRALHLTKDQHKEENSAKHYEMKNRGYSHNMISKLGFDPTTTMVKSQDASYKSPTRKRREHERVRELYELSNSKSKERTLRSSTEDQKSKISKWQENIQNLKRYKDSINNSRDPFSDYSSNTKTILHLQKPAKNRVIDDTDSSSDNDDLDIEFDTEEMKQSYLNRVRQS